MPKTGWDWLTVFSLWLGAALLAVKSTNLPLAYNAPMFLTSSIWGYLPLFLLSLAAVLMIARTFSPHFVDIDKNDQFKVISTFQPPIIEGENHEFLPAHLTPERILKSIQHANGIQSERLTTPFIGKWMAVKGTIYSVNMFGSPVIRLKGDPHFLISFCFDSSWTNKLSGLNGGDYISLIGQIESLSTISGIRLVSCELI